ncbi:1-phosphofructokinase [Caproicibacterium argilliputei]|uniref:Tagatose-6-phosphate kinase n=1 Tax=Caproicibacterium argilliputei TaxID=3030016 RepID=A0AA97DAM8_9FIRM|nr:1-phosphofructokinase [Caproicibacterium argilliputei]WOC32844.1 1-phosphofructokinase [Caproicibacterium argilliputei]
MGQRVLTVTLNPSLDCTVTVNALQVAALNRVVRAETDPGGKGINVARVLRHFGADVLATGFVAGDTGRQLLHFLERAQIAQDFLEIDGETRTNWKVFDEKVRKTTELNARGCPVPQTSLAAFREKFAQQCRQAKVAVFSGSLPPEVPADIYAKLIDLAKEAGVKTILDADGEALREGLKSVPYAVKPNIHELEALWGKQLPTPGDVLAAARRLLQTGISLVIVSMGADGAVVADARQAFRVLSWDIPVKSATGAGDSMVGALAYALLQGESLEQIARLTTAAGTRTAARPGTQLCERAEVFSSLQLVTVEPMENI